MRMYENGPPRPSSTRVVPSPRRGPFVSLRTLRLVRATPSSRCSTNAP